MADLRLDILVFPTYDVGTLAIYDSSTYPDSPPIVSGATISIDIPSFGIVSLPFLVLETNIFNSSNLGISDIGIYEPLPDGIYKLKYSISPATTNYVEKTIMRIDVLQEKFDSAFMKLDMMECDREIKTQSKVELNSIYLLIQGSIAAANNCAETQSYKLYKQASKMLDNFIKNNCGCSGNNYQVNFI